MGDKIEAKRTAAKLGLPLVPGSPGPLTSVSQAKQLAAEIGYPVLIKAASGGGGRGMKVVPSEDQLESLMSQAASEARSAFGDDTVYMEKYWTTHATSSSRCSATGGAERFTSASAIAHSNGATRKYLRKLHPRSSSRKSAIAWARPSAKR